MSLKQLPKPGMETAAALIGTAFSAMLLVLTAMNAGPLWRDEVNTLNMAQMPSLKDLWNNLPCESFPPLWPLLLRVCGILGLTGSDAHIRVLGLGVGLCFLASLWLCSRWMGGRAPILSVALLGSLPAFVFIIGANRAYGLSSCLLVLSFGMVWRMVESPSKLRVIWAGLVCLLFTQCVYFDGIFLCAILAGGAMVTIRRRQWKSLCTLVGMGAVSGASMMIYLPVIQRGSPFLPLIREPLFHPSAVWYGFCDALAARSSANPDGANGPQIWIWVELLLAGVIIAIALQRTRGRQTQNPEEAALAGVAPGRSELALYCVTSLLIGIAAFGVFLIHLQFFMQTWYYVELLSLCAISLDGILSACWPALRPWGLFRIGFMVVMLVLGAKAAWAEAHTRRSNVDLAATFLGQKASEGDLIVVQGAWEGITFNRYYHGQTHWVTVPPIDSHEVHRNDLVLEKMNQPEAMAPVLREITSTLRSGHSVWLVGSVPVLRPKELPPLPPPPPPGLSTGWWLGSYLYCWNTQVALSLLDQAQQEQAGNIFTPGPVSSFENVSVRQFSGYKPEAE
ncbi:MAG TPA: hypothetical protein VN784_13635 [Candidatus Limnocylindrales bacterium]|nr:hypothetical protein [Candidatus Limnocylindrales bacterium]